jgi:acyl dehydratase
LGVRAEWKNYIAIKTKINTPWRKSWRNLLTSGIKIYRILFVLCAENRSLQRTLPFTLSFPFEEERVPYKPRGLYFEQFNVGDEYVCQDRTITEADVVHFAGISGDYNPLHTSQEYAKSTPFGERIAHGVLVLAIATGQINQLGIFEGTTLALLQQTIKYTGVVRFGDTIHLEFKIAEKKETSKPDRGILTLENRVLNQEGKEVLQVQEVVMVRRRA